MTEGGFLVLYNKALAHDFMCEANFVVSHLTT
jgi:hypothetical protein